MSGLEGRSAPRRRRRAVLVVLAALLVSGCQARLAIELVVDRDGGGVLAVSLGADAELLAQAEAADADPLGDLAAAGAGLADDGWRVDDTIRDDGRTVRLATGFSSPEELGVLADDLADALAAPEVVPLEDLRVSVEDDVLRLSGVAGLVPTEEVTDLGLQPDQAVELLRDTGAIVYELTATLPGEMLETNADGDGQTVTWRIRPGERMALVAVAQRPGGDWWLLTLAGAGGGALVLGLLALLRRRGPVER